MRRWLGWSVLGLGLGSFLAEAGHEAAVGAFPALVAMLQKSPLLLGLVEGLSNGLASLAKLGAGWLADRRRWRKVLLVGGQLAAAISTGAFGLPGGWPTMLAARTGGWLARSVRNPTRDALLAGAAPREAAGRVFGFHRAMNTVGAVVGPLAATLLVMTVWPMRTLLLSTALPGALSALVLLALVRARGMGSPSPSKERAFEQSLRALPAPFRRLLVAVGVYGMGDLARPLLILRTALLLVPDHGLRTASLVTMGLYTGHNVAYAAASYPAGLLGDRVSLRTLLVLGHALGCATAILAAFAGPSLLVLVPLFALAGVAMALQDTMQGAVTRRLVADELRGLAYGALGAATGAGESVASIAIGALWTLAGARVSFILAGAAAALGTLLLYRVPSLPPDAANA